MARSASPSDDSPVRTVPRSENERIQVFVCAHGKGVDGGETDPQSGMIGGRRSPDRTGNQGSSSCAGGVIPGQEGMEKQRMKTVFTTGEAAKICKVSQQTIIRCFDNGQLKGFRVPGSRFRRIPREALYKFMKDNGIPTDALESGKRKVLLVDDDAELVELMTKVLEEDGRFEVRIAANGFDAGMMVKEYRPDLIILDVMLPDIN